MISKSKHNNIKLEISVLTLIISLIAYIIYLMIYNTNPNSEYNNYIFLLSWGGIFLYVYILVTWYKLSNTLFSPYIIFMTFMFLFNFGQCFMWAFGIHHQNEIGQAVMYRNFGVASDYDIINAQALTLISILMFHLGAVLSYKSYNKKINLKKEDSISLKSLYISCLIVSIVVIPITLYFSYTDFQIAKQYGYGALYYSDHARTSATISTILTKMFIPCLIGLLLGSKYSKKTRLFVYTVFAIYMIFYLISGDRGTWVYNIFILVWLSHVCYKPLNKRLMLKHLIIGVLGLYVVDMIVSFRSVGIVNLDLKQVLNDYSFENSPIISAIFEMGSSMHPTIILQKYGWDVWPYANTYFLAILGMVTNNFIYIFDLPFELLSTWFSQGYLNISWGAGFSIIAEALLNVGPIFSPFILLIQGYIISVLINIPKGLNYKERPIRYFFNASTLSFFISISRNELHLILKNWFYGIIILILFVLIIRKFLVRWLGDSNRN